MTDPAHPPEPPYHLFLDADEPAVAAVAGELLISDEAHEPAIRQLAREVLGGLQQPPTAEGRLTVTLTPGQMKVLYTAAELLLGDLQREQADERDTLHSILDKLPDEHTMRAITLDEPRGA